MWELLLRILQCKINTIKGWKNHAHCTTVVGLIIFFMAVYLVAPPTVKSHWSKLLLHRILCMFWLTVIVPFHTSFTLLISDKLLSTHSCQSIPLSCFGNWWPIPMNTNDTVAGLSTTLRLCKWWPISMIFYDIRFRFFFFYKDHTFLYESHCTNSYIATMKNGVCSPHASYRWRRESNGANSMNGDY